MKNKLKTMREEVEEKTKVKLLLGSCEVVMKKIKDNSIDTIITDPPYELNFMGKGWDRSGVAFNVALWAECLRIAKPGAMLMCFGGTRTFHRIACAIEDAGWQIRDTMMWIYGSGFPKSLDIGKAIDREAGAERAAVGLHPNARNTLGSIQICKKNGDGMLRPYPATAAAKQWNGYGTALKPAFEPIIVAMKPLDGTFAQNAQKWGVAGLWIDGGRVGTETITTCGGDKFPNIYSKFNPAVESTHSGRWPANILHDGSDEVVEGFPVTGGGAFPKKSSRTKNNCMSGDNYPRERERRIETLPGSAARFFYCAKASKSERNANMDKIYCGIQYIPTIKDFGGGSCQDVNMALVELLKKVTSESIVKWYIGECGKSIMGVCQKDHLSIILMEINKTTELKICNLLTQLLTKEYILDANCKTVNGGNLAENVANSSGCQQTIIKDQTALALGVNLVVSEMLSKIKKEENWEPFVNNHSTVKPLALIEYLCKLTKTPTGGIVLDPFMGSGTTGVACLKTDRKFIGIEKDENYFEIAKKRIDSFYEKNKVKD